MSGSLEADPRIGSEIAGYRIERLLGRGASGDTYLAEDGHGHRVVLKLVAEGISGAEGLLERFLRDVDRLAALEHAHVVGIRGVGEADGRLYLVTHHVEVTDLEQLLAREGPLVPSLALLLVGQAARALDAARWARGVVHGNLRPSNVLISEPSDPGATAHVYVTDFGLWRAVDAASGTDGDGVPDACIGYLAPEQIRGEQPSSRSDQYALGCVLYECLTGAPPFRGRSQALVHGGHLHAQPAPLRSSRPDLPAGLDDVIGRALAKSPRDRYSTCEEFIACARAAAALGEQQAQLLALEGRLPVAAVPPALEQALREEIPQSRAMEGEAGPAPDGLVDTSGERRRRRLSAVSAVLVLAALAAGVILLTRSNGGDLEAEAPAQLEAEARPEAEAPAQLEAEARPEAEAPAEAEAAVVEAEAAAVEAEAPAPLVREAAEEVGGDGGEPLPHLHTLVRIDPATNEPAAVFPRSESDPFLSARGVGEGVVWGIVWPERTVSGIDSETGTAAATVSVRGSPLDLAVSEGAVWVISSQGGGGWLTSLDPASGEVRGELRLGLSDPVALAAGEGAVWVAAFDSADFAGNVVYRIDPAGGEIVATVPLAARPAGIAADDESVWVTVGTGYVRAGGLQEAPSIVRIDPATNEVAAVIDLDFIPAGITVAEGAAWVTGSLEAGGTLRRIDPATNRVSELIEASANRISLAAGKGSLWVASFSGGTVSRLDPTTGELVATIEVGGPPSRSSSAKAASG